jgi:ABC-type branched-subunit amino acid transport system substrate-binding protein
MASLDPRVKENWKRVQRQHAYPVNAIGMRIDSNDASTLKVWRDEGLDAFVKARSESKSGPTSKTGLVVAAAILMVAAAAIGGWQLYGAKDKDNQAKEVNEIVTPEIGVTDKEVLLGMSAAFTGPAAELGIGMRAGIEACFHDVNDKGGVHGRKLSLVSLDDGYEDKQCLENMHDLLDNQKVFATIGNVGTPTAKVAVPFTMEKKRIFFGAYTGAGLLRRTPPDRYVFNYRASYEEETAAIVRFLAKVKKVPLDQIAVFAQIDAYGDSGFQGVVKMVETLGGDPKKILRVGYERNTVNVEAAAQEILKQKGRIKAIVMVPAYKPAAKFIQLLKDNDVNAFFASVSFVNSGALAQEFKKIGLKYAEGVIVAQVVPHYKYIATSKHEFEECLRKYSPNQPLDFISLEGYIAARLFVAGLEKTGRNLTTERLVEALESIKDLTLETGGSVSFGPTEHQGSHTVWGTMLNSQGEYQPLLLD